MSAERTDEVQVGGPGQGRDVGAVRPAELTSAAARPAAAATVVTVLHPVLLPLLVLSVTPLRMGRRTGRAVEHAAHHRNLGDSRLRNVFRSYTTERNTADEVRAGTMAGFLTRQYRIASGRLEAEQLTATRQALVVQGAGDALTAVGTLATWSALVLLMSPAAWISQTPTPPPSCARSRSSRRTTAAGRRPPARTSPSASPALRATPPCTPPPKQPAPTPSSPVCRMAWTPRWPAPGRVTG